MEEYVMDASDFREQVFSKVLPTVSRPLLDMVIGAFVATGQHEQRDISPCIQLVGILQKSGLELPEDVVRHQPVGTARSTRPTPEMRLRSAQLTNQIAASVQAVRQTLFGQPSAPFASLPKAIAWIEGEVRQLYEGIAAWARALYQPLWDHALEPSPLVGEPGAPESSQRLAVLLDAMQAGIIGSIAPAESGGLHDEKGRGVVDPLACRFQRYVRQLARASGFSPPAVAAFALADVPPILDAATISVEHLTVPVPFGGEIQRSQVMLTVHARDLSYDEHRDLFRQVRQELHLVRAHGLTDEDIELLKLVDSLGLPPKGRGSGAYWTRVQRAWKRRHPEKRCESVNGPRIRYGRLQKKLKDLGLDGLLSVQAVPPQQKPRRSRPR
jgi:hypothetical protein